MAKKREKFFDKYKITEYILLILFGIFYLLGVYFVFIKESRFEGIYWLYASIVTLLLYGLFRKLVSK